MKTREINCTECESGIIKIEHKLNHDELSLIIHKCSHCEHRYTDFDSLFEDIILNVEDLKRDEKSFCRCGTQIEEDDDGICYDCLEEAQENARK